MSTSDDSGRRVNVRGIQMPTPSGEVMNERDGEEEDTFSLRTTHVLADFDESFTPQRLRTRQKVSEY